MKHPLTNDQKIILELLLNQIKDAEKLDPTTIYNDIFVLGSDYCDCVFIRFIKIGIGDNGDPYEKTIHWGIESDGHLNDNPVQTMDFKTLSDRVHFFNTLFKIDFPS